MIFEPFKLEIYLTGHIFDWKYMLVDWFVTQLPLAAPLA
jgi:hypothetical protein